MPAGNAFFRSPCRTPNVSGSCDRRWSCTHVCQCEHWEHSPVKKAQIHRWTASDGIELAYHEVGKGRPVVLLHGLFSDAQMNWIKFGHADRIAREGFRVIMPDLRAHGRKRQPHGAAIIPQGKSWPATFASLIAQLELDRVRPWRIFAGITHDCRRRRRGTTSAPRDPRRCRSRGAAQLEAAQDILPRSDRACSIPPARRPALAVDPVHEEPEGRPRGRGAAARQLRRYIHGLARRHSPCRRSSCAGARMKTTARPRSSANVAPQRRVRGVPGTHMSSVTKPQFGEAIAEFVAAA